MLNELDPEFFNVFGDPIAIQSETNLANDEEANERIQIVEYKPEPTKYARIFDVGNGWWNLIDLVCKDSVIVYNK